METTDKLEKRQSELIKAMRFPLIVLVLYVHSVRPEAVPMEWSLEGHNVFRIFTEIVSHYIGGLSLCWFFFFSGFLFYYNKKHQFGWHWVKGKYKRRVKSILIPYIVWNLLNVAVILVVTSLFGWAGITVSRDPLDAVEKGPLYWFITGPIDFPLWYLRELIVLSILAPILYYPVKKWPGITLLVLLACYVAPIFGFDTFLFPSFSFFGLGAFMSIRRDNLVGICHRFRHSSAILALVLLVVTVIMCNSGNDNKAFLLFAPFGMVTFMNFCNWLFNHEWIKTWMLKLTETVFFIYAAHEIYILGWTKGAFLRVLGDALWAQWISFLLVPIVTLCICLVLFYLMKRIMPEVLAFLCGFRTVHKYQ